MKKLILAICLLGIVFAGSPQIKETATNESHGREDQCLYFEVQNKAVTTTNGSYCTE